MAPIFQGSASVTELVEDGLGEVNESLSAFPLLETVFTVGPQLGGLDREGSPVCGPSLLRTEE